MLHCAFKNGANLASTAGYGASVGLLFSFLGFAQPPPTAFSGLLVVARALDLLGQTLFLAHLLETSEHLIEGFIASGFDLDHASECPFS